MGQRTESKDRALARKESIVVQEMPDEVLVYDLKSHQAHCLNPAAAFVWNHCDGQTTATEIAALMEKELHKPISEDVVWLALKQLGKANLLQQPLVGFPEEKRISRRSIMHKLGLAAAASLPLVTSVIAPPAASAATVPPVCTVCRKKSDGACPTDCGPTILGTCYSNSGCGSGQELPKGSPVCMSCEACFGNPAFGVTISWEAPGTLAC